MRHTTDSNLAKALFLKVTPSHLSASDTAAQVPHPLGVGDSKVIQLQLAHHDFGELAIPRSEMANVDGGVGGHDLGVPHLPPFVQREGLFKGTPCRGAFGQPPHGGHSRPPFFAFRGRVEGGGRQDDWRQTKDHQICIGQ